MKHGTICKIFDNYFDYSGKTNQGYPRGRHLVNNGRLIWASRNKNGNIISDIYKTTDNEFQVATPDEVEMFNKIINMDNFSTDLHNTLIDLLFEYNQKGMNVSKSQFEKEINIFIDKFYNYN